MLCKHCSVDKPQEDFKKNKICKSGYEGTCKVCTQARQKKWEHSHYEQHRDNQLRWRSEHQEQYQLAKWNWYDKNRDTVNAQSVQYAKDNAGWKRSATAKRRAAQLQAIPSWANLDKIKAIYIEAKQTGLVVDHIIPLQGKLVCGLHVENNLQLLTASENSQKHNKFTVY